MNDAWTIATRTEPTSFEALLRADQAALDAIPSGVCVCAADGEIVRYNRRAAELWGRTPRPGDKDERFCGATRLYHLDGRPLSHAFTPMAAALRTGEAQHDRDLVIERPDGSRAVVRVSIEALTGPGGQVEGAINCFHDITDEQSAFRLAAIVDSSDDAITSKDLDGTVTSWNQGAERLYGYTAEEVLGRHITLLFPESLLAEEEEILARIRRGERTEHYETVRRRKDGSLIDISITVSPVVDARGMIVGASTISRDISKRKADEAALARRIREQAALYAFVDRMQRTRSQTEICDAALDAIIGALDCERASILLSDQEGVMRFVVWRGLSEGYRKAVDGHSPWKPGEREAGPVLIPDIDRASQSASIKATVRKEGIRGLAFIPIMAQGAVIGKFMTYYDAPHEFADHEVELALTIARQLGFGLERLSVEQARVAATEELRRNEERLRLATRAGKVGLWEREVGTGRIVWTDSLYAIYGIEKTKPYLTPAEFEALVHPKDRKAVAEAARQAIEKEAPYQAEFRAVRPDRQEIWLFANGIVVRDTPGPRLAGVTIDITERKRAEAQRELLLAELNHRVKNTLAIVQGIAQQTFRNSRGSVEAQRAFEGRLVNLAAAHTLLTAGNWQTAALEDLAADALQITAHEGRISLAGPRILLGPKQALAIVIALHELYTNAVKYGALSNETGSVSFTWRTADGRAPLLHMEWHERNGPVVSKPTERGFGSRMIEQALAQDLGARVIMDFRPAGLVCTIDAPLQDIAKDQE